MHETSEIEGVMGNTFVLAQQGGGALGGLLPLLIIGVLFYFLLIRPQQKRARAQRELHSSLSVGDMVVTIGGFHVRAPALLAGQIDATPPENSAVAPPGSAAGGPLVAVADLAGRMADLHPQTVYANSDFVADHRGLAHLTVRVGAQGQHVTRALARDQVAGATERHQDGGAWTLAAQVSTFCDMYDSMPKKAITRMIRPRTTVAISPDVFSRIFCSMFWRRVW